MFASITTKLATRLRRFRGEEEGTLVIFALFLFVLMVTFGGLAIDIMKYETVRTNLANTLDRCTLMAAGMTQQLDPQSVVEDCVAKAGLSEQLQDVTVVDALSSREVKATATADTAPVFLHMIGIDSFDAHAVSAASQSITNVEIALVLDVSGSMGGAKIENLRIAASDFVATMLDNDPNHRISISIVPYNAQVNLGPTLRSKFNVTHAHDVPNVDCLELPYAAFDQLGISRSMELPMMAFDDHFYDTSYVDAYVDLADTSVARPSIYGNFCLPTTNNVVRTASQDKEALQAQINGLTAGGNTSIMLGMKWGTTLLDPGSRSIYDEYIAAGLMSPEMSGRPFDYDDDRAMKVIVLMTDGEHVPHNSIRDEYKSGLSPIYRSTGDGMYSIYHAASPGIGNYWVPHLGVWQTTPWTNDATPPVQQDWRDVWANMKVTYVAWQLYGRPLGIDAFYNAYYSVLSTYASAETMDSQLQATCTQAKEAGVIVYGIAFEAPANGQLQISQCASSPQHFFAAVGPSIGTAFDMIASNLTMLKLTQ